MTWMLDASVLLAAEDRDDDNHAAARLLLAGPDPLMSLDLAFYEVNNVAIRSWHEPASARRLTDRLTAIEEDGGVARCDADLLAAAVTIAAEHGLSVYDASYVAAARRHGCRLVSCDVRDLVGRDLAILPRETV